MIERWECPKHGQRCEHVEVECDRSRRRVRYFSLPEIKALLTEHGPMLAFRLKVTETWDYEDALGAAVDALADAIPSEEKTDASS
jgi:hypothetical protein